MDPRIEFTIVAQHDQPIDPSSEQINTAVEVPREDREDEKLTVENNLEQKGRELNENNDVAPVASTLPKQELQETPAELDAQQEKFSSDKTSSESSSDEDMAIMNKSEALELFNKMTKESIQKLMQSDSSNEGSLSEGTTNEKDIDEMINSNPQDLIMVNGHAHTQHKSNSQFEHSKKSTENHAKNKKPTVKVNEELEFSREDEGAKTKKFIKKSQLTQKTEGKQAVEECKPNEDDFQHQDNEEEEEQHQELNEGEDEEQERQLSDKEIREKLK